MAADASLRYFFVIFAQVAVFALGKSVYEERQLALAKNNNTAATLGLPFSATGNPPLDDATAQVRIYLTIFRMLDSIPKHLSRDFFLCGQNAKTMNF